MMRLSHVLFAFPIIGKCLSEYHSGQKLSVLNTIQDKKKDTHLTIKSELGHQV